MKRCPDLDRLNEALPVLEAALMRLDRLRTELGARSNELERMGYRPGPGAQPDDPEEISARRRIISQRQAEYEAELAKLREAGAVVIDLQSGSLGFRSKLGDDPVFLSWKQGEARIEHYFPYDQEFRRRRRIDLD